MSEQPLAEANAGAHGEAHADAEVYVSDPYDEEARFRVHETHRVREGGDDEEARFRMHQRTAFRAEDAERGDDEEDRFRIHQQSNSQAGEASFAAQGEEEEEESRFMIHLQAKAAEELSEDADHRASLVQRASLEDEFDEEARFLVHHLEQQRCAETPPDLRECRFYLRHPPKILSQ